MADDSQGQQDIPPPAYTTLSTPVYCLATVDRDGGRPNLCLVTYAGPISLAPRHYALGLFVGTLSHEQFLASGCGLLQILGEQHAPLFELLGKRSGRDVDKLAELAGRGFEAAAWGSLPWGGQGLRQGGPSGAASALPLLADACGAMELRPVSAPQRCGDHDAVMCAVQRYTVAAREGARPLYTGRLRQLGLM